MGLLELVKVKKKVGGVVVLDCVELYVREGEFVVVRGVSGVGKTTLARILSLIESPEEGNVRFMGLEVGRLNREERAQIRLRHIGYVDQFFKLIPTMTVMENVELPLALMGVSKGERRERVLEALSQVGVEDKAYRYPSELSGGERQRVAIARALVKRPKLIVGDEPVSNLDDESAEEVFRAFRRAILDYSCAVVMTTTNFIMEIPSDKELALIGGKLVSRDELGEYL